MLHLVDEVIHVLALDHHVVHGEEGRAGGFGQLDKVLPAIGIVARVPHDAGNLVVHVALEAAHAMAFDEGFHVVFQDGEVVEHAGRHSGRSLP